MQPKKYYLLQNVFYERKLKWTLFLNEINYFMVFTEKDILKLLTIKKTVIRKRK